LKSKDLAFVGLFAAITSVMAQISIPLPFTPVPITFQLLAVCMAGAILGSRLGGLSILVYDLLGAVGIPVFAGFTGGLGSITGPRGGYIIAFPIAAFLIGYIIEHARSNKKLMTFIAMFAGLVIIYFLGMIQLSAVTGLNMVKAFYAGVLPFIPLDMVKIVIAAFISMPVREAVMRFSSSG
jgi:biotin transport system substrate-specific component